MNRKIIQIATGLAIGTEILTRDLVLCDDGTLWESNRMDEEEPVEWTRVKGVPQPPQTVTRTADYLIDVIEEVHAWAVCAPIASSDDMMVNIARIIEITTLVRPEDKDA